MRVIRGRHATWGLEVGPCGWDERATAVRQHEHQTQLIASMRPAQHDEGPAFKRMVLTGDRNAWRETVEMGSVWPFPSTRSHTRS